MIRPMVDCGVISRETGQWEGVTTSDEQFIGITTALNVPHGATTLGPDTNAYPSIDMTGFNDVFIAIKTSNGGTFSLTAVMGPDTLPFGGLTPVNAAATLRGAGWAYDTDPDMENLFLDTGETMTADVWNIFVIRRSLSNQKNLQIKVGNDSGGNSDVEFAFMRVV